MVTTPAAHQCNEPFPAEAELLEIYFATACHEDIRVHFRSDSDVCYKHHGAIRHDFDLCRAATARLGAAGRVPGDRYADFRSSGPRRGFLHRQPFTVPGI